MESRATSAAPDMQMKEEQEEQLADCKATNADWTVIHSRRQQKEGRNQGGKETNASNCQQSRAPTKSRRPRCRRRFRFTPEEFVDYTEKGIPPKMSGPPERKARMAPLLARPRDRPLLPIHALVPYCPKKPARRPRRQRLNRDLRHYPCSRRQAKVKLSGRGKENVDNSSSVFLSQQEADEAWIEHLDSIRWDDNGRRYYVKLSPSPCKPVRAKHGANAKPGVADRFFRSQQKWAKFYNRGKVIGCASGKPPSGGAACAPQSP